jgi:hypothetical protein
LGAIGRLPGIGGAGFEGRAPAPGVRKLVALGAVDRGVGEAGDADDEDPGKTGKTGDPGDADDIATGDDDGRPGFAGVATLEPTAACTANAAPPRTPATPSPTTAFVIQDPRTHPVQPGKGAAR